MSDAERVPVVSRDPEILGGLLVFAGTRVPAQTLLDYLVAGHTLDEFMDDFPSVSRDQASELLETLRGQLAGSTYETAA